MSKEADGQKRIKYIVLASLFALLAVVAADLFQRSQASKKAGDDTLSASVFSLDTFCTVTIYEGGDESALDSAKELLAHYDEIWSPSRAESDISRINSRTETRVAISEETASLLTDAKAFSAQSKGIFDVTVGKLTALWNIKNRTEPPEEFEIAKALAACGNDGFSIAREGQTWYFEADNSDIAVDVGAIAKGYIADRVKEELLSDGVTSAIINLGGNVLCVGAKPSGEPFRIGIKKPEKGSQEELLTVPAEDVSVVTAGIYERYFEFGGVHYHHILSTKDGWPVQNGLASVTVIGPVSEYCDALATTLFIMGEDDGSAFLQRFNENEGEGSYEAYFVTKKNTITKAKAFS